MKRIPWLLIVAIALPALAGCRGTKAKSAPDSLQLASSEFSSANSIPQQFTCDGLDQSPALSWSTPPAGTKSLALIVYDQSTPSPFTHWQIYNLPPDTRSLSQAVPAEEQLPNGARQTVNSFGKVGYGGPCPPHQSSPHRYAFELYALNTTLNLPADSTGQQLRSAMAGHVLADGKIIATYQRSSEPPVSNQKRTQ